MDFTGLLLFGCVIPIACWLIGWWSRGWADGDERLRWMLDRRRWREDRRRWRRMVRRMADCVEKGQELERASEALVRRVEVTVPPPWC